MGVETIQTYVVGCSLEGGNGGPACAACMSMKPDTGLVCWREPQNPKDVNAVRLHLPTGQFVGYVRREEAGVVAQWMDAGRTVGARVLRESQFRGRTVGKFYIIHHYSWPVAIVWSDEPEAETVEETIGVLDSVERERERTE